VTRHRMSGRPLFEIARHVQPDDEHEPASPEICAGGRRRRAGQAGRAQRLDARHRHVPS
jgi:hypothetical protein